jgi:hypothetical protein
VFFHVETDIANPHKLQATTTNYRVLAHAFAVVQTSPERGCPLQLAQGSCLTLRSSGTCPEAGPPLNLTLCKSRQIMNRMLKIISVIIFLIIAFKVLQFFGSQSYLNKENHNRRVNEEKSKLNCHLLPIHCAIRDKNYAQLNSIIPGDQNIESLDGFSRTPLHFAIAWGSDQEAVKILLSKGANPNVYDDNGNPPLLGSVMLKRYEITEDLLRHGAQRGIEITGKTVFGMPEMTPFDYCVLHNDLKCVLLFLQYGINVDWKNQNVADGTRNLSVYEMAKGNSNVSAEIKQLIEERHNPAFKRDAAKARRPLTLR